MQEKKIIFQKWNKKGWLVLFVLSLYAVSGIFFVGTDETGVVTRFGKIIRPRVPSGIHYRLPSPLERVYKVKTTAVFKKEVGFKVEEKVQGIPPDPEQTQWLTGDINIINLQLIIQLSIIDPVAYPFNVGGATPPTVLQKIVEANLTRLVGTLPIHDVLTSARSALVDRLKEVSQKEVDRLQLGVIIRSINLVQAEPPEEVIFAFNDVLNAKADRERLINEAQQYKNNMIPQAEGEADKQVDEAKGDKNALIEKARGDASYFASILAEYKKSRSVTAQRLYLETMEKILERTRKYLVQAGKEGIHLKLFDSAVFAAKPLVKTGPEK